MGPKNPAVTRRRSQSFLGIDGAVAVELAITAPLLVLLALGVADYGALMGSSAALEGAARAGAEVGKANPSVTAGQLTALSIFPTGVTPTVASVCTCGDNTWPGGATCPPPLTGVNPCTTVTNPYTGLTDTRVLQYVKVTGTQTYSPLFSYTSLAFPASLTAQTTTRTQ